jgi:PH domain.
MQSTSMSTTSTTTTTTTTTTRRQESHRVYLQQFTPRDYSIHNANTNTNASSTTATATSSANTLESSKQEEQHPPAVNTTSAAVRLTLAATTRDVTELLRRKFGLPENKNITRSLETTTPAGVGNGSTESSTFSSTGSLSALDRINSHLAMQRQRSSQVLSTTGNKTPHGSQPPPKKKKKKYDPFTDDTLVIVASCYVPKGYVHFEHETRAKVQSLSRRSAAAAAGRAGAVVSTTGNVNLQTQTTSSTHSGSEVFNLFQSLSPDDNPLLVKDAMYQKILSIQDEAVSCHGGQSFGSGTSFNDDDASSSKSPNRRIRKPPVIRFFFMPCHNGGVSNATIEMEGYCTDSQDDDEEEEEEEKCAVEDAKYDSVKHDDQVVKHDMHHQKQVGSNLQPWKRQLHPYFDNHLHKDNNNNIQSPLKKMLSKDQQILIKERRLFAILSGLEASSGTGCVSGYLLKQSMHSGGNVWKRVYCVLPTNDQLWYVTRAKHVSCSGGVHDHEEDVKAMTRDGNTMLSRCVGRHGVIDLRGTFLMEALETQSPVSGIPCAFQLMTKDGEVHTFRASSRNAYSKWMECISTSIVQCQENSYLELAEDMVRSVLLAKEGYA